MVATESRADSFKPFDETQQPKPSACEFKVEQVAHMCRDNCFSLIKVDVRDKRKAKQSKTHLKNCVPVVEQVLRSDGRRHISWSSCHKGYCFGGGDVLHHNLQRRHFVDKRLEQNHARTGRSAKTTSRFASKCVLLDSLKLMGVSRDVLASEGESVSLRLTVYMGFRIWVRQSTHH